MTCPMCLSVKPGEGSLKTLFCDVSGSMEPLRNLSQFVNERRRLFDVLLLWYPEQTDFHAKADHRA